MFDGFLRSFYCCDKLSLHRYFSKLIIIITFYNPFALHTTVLEALAQYSNSRYIRAFWNEYSKSLNCNLAISALAFCSRQNLNKLNLSRPDDAK